MTLHMKKEDRKAQVLEAVGLFLQEQGYPPSYRDLAADVGVSHSIVFGLVKELRSDGLIDERPAQTSRAITLTPDGRAALRERIQRSGARPTPD